MCKDLENQVSLLLIIQPTKNLKIKILRIINYIKPLELQKFDTFRLQFSINLLIFII